ncbi:MAG: PilZ domain-containing protein [Methylococcales bacterium]|jgi:hypothetical protein|nr:PilZ domain-containing protein [Methylococcales bacterium]MBT7444671.1 PilZ domain-containing protein [Methylococcales bacterium]
MNSDQRSCRRYAIPGVTTKVLQTSMLGIPSYTLPFNVVNIGKGGVLVEAAQKFKLGESIDLEIEGPNTRSIYTTAEVCYRTKTGDGFNYGFKFEEIDVNVIRQVRQLCA